MFKRTFLRIRGILINAIYLKIFIRLILCRFCKYYRFISDNYIIFYLILISRLIGYAILLPRLVTKRLYRILGIIRVFIVILRFEISLFLLIILVNILNHGNRINITMLIIPVLSIFCIFIFIIEINRHPFEVIEGESELVSGFNIELRSLVFIVYFLSEIINITVIVIIMCLLYNILTLYAIIIVLLLLIRSRYPRIRYDFIIIFQWTTIYLIIISLIYL